MSKRMDSVYATAIGIVLAVVVVFIVLIAVRFVFGGPEDSWICSGGVWSAHGNPSAPKPTTPCFP